tara:strand:+ start:302 stop:493 length:192 start_codon:yes stop_codon:yes gene_type:complete
LFELINLILDSTSQKTGILERSLLFKALVFAQEGGFQLCAYLILKGIDKEKRVLGLSYRYFIL